MICRPVEEEGFAMVPGVIRPEQADFLSNVIEQFQKTLPPDQSPYGIRHLLRVPEVRELATCSLLRDLAAEILGPLAFPVRGIFFDKTPEANWKVAWHQDVTIMVKEKQDVEGFSAWSRKEGAWHVQPPPEILERMLTARLHLDDCDETNGPVKVIPGSHRLGRLAAEQIAELRNSNPVLCNARKGDVLLMRPLLLHASSPSKTPRHRRVIHIEFAAEELPGGLRWRDVAG